MPVLERHFVNGQRIVPPFPEGTALAMFGLGCFWGAEKKFWNTPASCPPPWATAGSHPEPHVPRSVHGMTGHNEVVLVAFDPKRISYDELLRVFWENHDPTQGMRQGADTGTQYRSGIYTYGADQQAAAEASKTAYAAELRAAGFAGITTEVIPAPEFFYAEEYHQQYLAKNPDGYCGIGGTGVACPIGLAKSRV
jgi:peptide-methionine (S)-S-oxide reductase